MTFKEKLAADHPDWSEETLNRHARCYCPWELITTCSALSFAAKIEMCDNSSCKDCWNQEIPKENIPEEPSAPIDPSPDKITKWWQDIWKSISNINRKDS